MLKLPSGSTLLGSLDFRPHENRLFRRNLNQNFNLVRRYRVN